MAFEGPPFSAMSDYCSSEYELTLQIKWLTSQFEVYHLNPSQEGSLCVLSTVQSNKIPVLSIRDFFFKETLVFWKDEMPS